jgi:hypothetical protein
MRFPIPSSVSIAIVCLNCSAQPIPKRRVPLRLNALLPGLGDPVVAKDCKLMINVHADFTGELSVLFGYAKVLR